MQIIWLQMSKKLNQISYSYTVFIPLYVTSTCFTCKVAGSCLSTGKVEKLWNFTLEPVVNLMEQYGAHLPVPYFVPFNMAFQVLTVSVDMLFLYVMPYNWVNWHHYFSGICCLGYKKVYPVDRGCRFCWNAGTN
jgi:hypothetical protein